MGGGGMGGMGGMGGGFFSIPPLKVAQVPFQSVCLNYGRPDPMPKMTYRLTPLEEYTDDKVLQQTVRLYGTGKMPYSVAQAATWHLTDKLSLEQLANLSKFGIPGDETTKEPIFTVPQLRAAIEIVGVAKLQAAEREKTEVKKPTPVKKRLETSVTSTRKTK